MNKIKLSSDKISTKKWKYEVFVSTIALQIAVSWHAHVTVLTQKKNLM